MTLSLVLACLWILLAALLGMLPQQFHWRFAYGLVVLGIPILGYVTYQNGPAWGLVCLAAGASVLRWPLLHFGRWLIRPLRGARREGE